VQGKRVVVTGGSTGIGRAVVAQLAREGAEVLTFARTQEPLDELADLVRDMPGAVHTMIADIAERADVERIFAAADEKIGGIDILVSNAALGAEPIDQMEENDWRYVVEVNLVGALSCARQALKRMAGGGHILIIGSISAEIHAPGESVYSATKAGLQAFSETLRKEVAERRIRVSLIEPGSVGSDMQEAEGEEERGKIARHEMLVAEDIAEATLFVLSRPERCDVVSLRIEPRIQELI
jgi:3-hydroxy acid dehydrogenase / malonic semialdehyde reductase